MLQVHINVIYKPTVFLRLQYVLKFSKILWKIKVYNTTFKFT